ncbi:MAG TPA: hypothetical protein VKS78_07320 [Roseiarcus sp.]|nr:hypothetical protein [Roseiarcus sp.]
MRSFLRVAAFGALLSVGLFSGSALACKGTTTLFRDDFSSEDPAWGLTDPTTAKVADGAMQVTTKAGGYYANLLYQGMNFPGADACIDIVFPATPTKAATQGGFGVWTGRGWDFIYIASDGTAGVQGLQGNNWVTPVPARKAASLKATPGATNTLRIVWAAPPADNAKAAPDPFITIYINDALFIKYKAVPNSNNDRALAIYAVTEGTTYLFKNLAVTQPQ